jgi:para-aminobenzoate synthetase/4-amino-4-deoxychorismate lyase
MMARILIDNSLEPGASSFLFEAPRGEIRADAPEEVDGALAALSRALAGGTWAAGFFAYELGYLLEPRLRPLLPENRPVPLLRFALFDAPEELTPERTQTLLEAWTEDGYTLAPPGLSMDRDAYRERFARAKAYIAAGDIYQINLTLKARFGLEGCPVALYRDLRRKQPVAHGALMRFGDLTVLSHSPELFLGIRGGTAFSRPMKGTAARAVTPEQDRERREWLARDEKSRAENLMILDLMRNDLGRVAETGF